MTTHRNQAMWKKNFQFSSLQGHFNMQSEQVILRGEQAIARHNQAPWLDENLASNLVLESTSEMGITVVHS